MYYVKVLLIVCAVTSTATSSAIPMWEYLTQNEKVMYLFNMFQLQVQEFCKNDAACKQDLKNYGWRKLKAKSEDELDEMDPFQRNSNDIIWDSVMEGRSTPKTPSSSFSLKPEAFEDFPENDTKSDASAKIETIEKILPPKGFNPQIIVESGTPEYKRKSEIFENYSSNGITTENLSVNDSPLQGPWVVKVHPDGSPVRESPQVVPEDDDLSLYQMTKVVLDNV